MDHLIDDSDRTKPCPFCGGHASMGYVDRGQGAGGRYIACDTCGASTNLRFACGDDPMPLLLEQWNKRVGQREEADLHAVMRRLVAGIDHLDKLTREWEPDHSSGADRRGWLLAKDARDDAVRALGPNDRANAPAAAQET